MRCRDVAERARPGRAVIVTSGAPPFLREGPRNAQRPLRPEALGSPS